MSDNEILAKWQGFNPDVNDVEGYYLPKGRVYDYLTDSAACMSLLDTLVEKGYEYNLCYNYRKVDLRIFKNDTERYIVIEPTINEAVISACLEVARKEQGDE